MQTQAPAQRFMHPLDHARTHSVTHTDKCMQNRALTAGPTQAFLAHAENYARLRNRNTLPNVLRVLKAG